MKLRLNTPVLVLLAGVLLLTLPIANGDERKPNIIYIMLDDAGFGDLNVEAEAVVKTPNFARMANEGTLFTNHYCGSAVCAPTRCVLMTGLHTGHCRRRDNTAKANLQDFEKRPLVFLEDEDFTVAEALKSVGYQTCGIGKWGLGNLGSNGAPTKQGFDQWYGYLDQVHAHNHYTNYLISGDQRFDLPENAKGQKGVYVHDLFERQTLKYIRDHKEDPFFLYLAYTLPHGKYDIPADDSNLKTYASQKWPPQVKHYAAMVSRADQTVGAILDLLKELQLENDTIVFYTSDNGPNKPFVKPLNSAGGLRGIKRQLYEGGLRSKMVVRWPGKVPAKTTSKFVWGMRDFFPTACDLAGAKAPANLDGISVLPTLLGKAQEPHQHLYWEIHSPFQQAVRMGDWKGIRFGTQEPVELYLLTDDPGEKKNIAADHGAVADKIARIMNASRTESRYWPAKTKRNPSLNKKRNRKNKKRSKSNNHLATQIEKSIDSIERGMVGYRENRRCFSCHHHAHAIIALSEMANRGLNVDRELLQLQFARTVGRTKSVEQRYRKNQNIGGGIDTTGHALLAMRVGGYQPDEKTEAMVKWILNRDRDQGFWTGTTNRPPTQTSNVTRTWLCLNALNHFGTKELTEQITQRQDKSRQWLLTVETGSTEDQVSRIRALSVLGDAKTEIKKFAAALIKEQRADGGWAQTSEMKSDAYATGSVLMTLHQNAGLSTNAEFYRKGIAFLKSTQLDDGTWHVKTRATPVQQYFESGFPHGRDQYISFTATCWAATAMALTLPKSAPHENLTSSAAKLNEENQQKFQTRFKKEVWPLITENGKSSCIRCHNAKHRSSFRLSGDANADFATLLATGFLHPRDPAGILFPMTSKDTGLMMPPAKLPRLTDRQIETIQRFTEDLQNARIKKR